jgi:F-type H+-transporting ATPase subunit epsilon
MPLTLEIVTPDRRAYTGEADSVTLPTALGSIGILKGHLPITSIIEAGEVVVVLNGKTSRLAVDKGFVRVVSDKVSVVTEAAIDEAKIDLKAIDQAEDRARQAVGEEKGKKEIDPVELAKIEQILRFAAVQRMVKGRSSSGLTE